MLMGIGKHLRSFSSIVQVVARGGYLIAFISQVTLSIGHGFLGHQEKVFLFHSVEQMCCMYQTPASILIKEKRVVLVFSEVSLNPFLFEN